MEMTHDPYTKETLKPCDGCGKQEWVTWHPQAMGYLCSWCLTHYQKLNQ